jgi:hypothetical protein
VSGRLSLKDNFQIVDFYDNFNNHRYKDTATILNDLKRLFAVLTENGEYLIKRNKTNFDGSEINFIETLKETDIRNALLNTTCVIGDEKIKLWQLFKQNRQCFYKTGYHFRSDKKGVQSVFEGLDYKLLKTVNIDLINPFLNHIKLYWCDNNENLFNYVLKWLAFPVKHTGKKTRTGLILQVPQGCGKNAITDRIATLTDPYSSRNITNINDITGNFNSLIENKAFVVCNELKSDKNDKIVDTNALKALITENVFIVNEKFIKKREAQNVSNFVFISNNTAPFKIDMDDRRYCVLHCQMPENRQKYFNDLHKTFEHPDFYDNLYSYLCGLDLPEDFNFVHSLPTTDLKEATQDVYKTPFEEFITANYDNFIEGWKSDDCTHSAILALNNQETKTSYKPKQIQLELIKFCGKAKQMRKNGAKAYYYQLLSCYIESLKPREEPDGGDGGISPREEKQEETDDILDVEF